jgi:hypothetical protein
MATREARIATGEARRATGGRRPIYILAPALSVLAGKGTREGAPIASH